MLIVSIIFIRNLLKVDSGENTSQMTSFQYNVDFQQISSVVFVLLLLTANFIHRYFIYVFMYIFFVEFERISHNSFTIIYYVFKEILLFILMLLILTLNKIHNLFSVINVEFEHHFVVGSPFPFGKVFLQIIEKSFCSRNLRVGCTFHFLFQTSLSP